jgi:hypothetical protein
LEGEPFRIKLSEQMGFVFLVWGPNGMASFACMGLSSVVASPSSAVWNTSAEYVDGSEGMASFIDNICDKK